MKKLSICLFLMGTFISATLKAQFVQPEFIIAGNWAPPLVQETATPAPADYSGDGKADLASRINTGPNQGKFQIDNYSAAYPWFQKQGWSYISTSAIYGTATDYVVPADYDGDSKADIAVYFPATRIWRVDLASNGFGSWDASYNYSSYPSIDATAIPTPAKYDNNDSKADIAFKTNSGLWIFDMSSNGFGTIDATKSGYGDNTGHPVPADYDGDGAADLSVKTDAGDWKIDYFVNNYAGWDVTITGCGDVTNIPVPGKYSADARVDIAVKTSLGSWKICNAAAAGAAYTSGAVTWSFNPPNGTYAGVEAVPAPADFNGDGRTDFSFAFTNDGRWFIDNYAAATGGYEWISYPGKVANDFNTASLNPADVTNYTKFKNCYFNLALDAPMANSGYDNTRDYFLSVLDNVGVNTMLSDKYIYAFGDPAITTTFDRTVFTNHYRNVIPANLENRIYGINLGDEPTNIANDGRCTCNPLTRINDWSVYFGQQYPEKPTFNNLLPSYWSGFGSLANFGTYLDQYKLNSNSPFVCFDHYPFRASFLTSYFDNLSMIKSKFKDRSLWSTLWSAGSQGDITNPTEQQLQFGAFCPIAYGAKGIVYFPYDKSYNPTQFNLALNDDATKYNYAKNINLFLKNIAGPVAVGSVNIATLHKLNTTTNSTTYGYTLPSNSAELINNYSGIVQDVSNTDIVTGVFAKNILTSDPKILSVGNYYLWLMNKNTTATTNVVVTLRGNYTGNIQVSPRALNYVSNPVLTYTSSSSTYNSSLNTTSFTIPALGGGEGIMVKLFSAANEGVPADYDGDHIKDISVKEYDGTWLIDYSANGFGKWDWWGTGYGNATWHPIPVDFDGDGKADLSVKTDAGEWKIDYANNGFGTWDFQTTTYGDITARPCPADYDGDGKTDMSVKTDAGLWFINYANDGFGGWNINYPGFGNSTWHAIPVDFDGDGKADLSVKTDAGEWKIDYAINGFGTWDFQTTTYGDATAHPVPADYDGDGKADMSVKTDAGNWHINYANNGWGGWDNVYSGYGNATAIPLPGDYGGDKKADLSIKYPNGDWKIDYSVNGFGSWDDIVLKPVYNTVGSARPMVASNAEQSINTNSESCSIDQNKQYRVLAIYDVTGALFKKIDQVTSLKLLKTKLNFKTGVYYISIIDRDKSCTGKIFISK